MITEMEILKMKCWQLQTMLETKNAVCEQQHRLIVALERENSWLQKQIDEMSGDIVRAAGG